MNDFDPTTQIAILWSIDDVQEQHPLLSNQEALHVLKAIKKNHDACTGINWDTIDVWAHQLYPKLAGKGKVIPMTDRSFTDALGIVLSLAKGNCLELDINPNDPAEDPELVKECHRQMDAIGIIDAFLLQPCFETQLEKQSDPKLAHYLNEGECPHCGNPDIKEKELRLVVQVEGGILQDICSNSPMPIKVYIVDYDTKDVRVEELMATPGGDVVVGHQVETRCDEIYVNSIFKSV